MNRATDPDSGLRSGSRLYGEIQTRTQTLVSDEQKWGKNDLFSNKYPHQTIFLLTPLMPTIKDFQAPAI
jgi:hypothetical protein